MRMQEMAKAAMPNTNLAGDAGLLPLRQFDHPSLHRRSPKWLPLAFARGQLNTLFLKACAGLNPELRVDGWDVALGFRKGEFSCRELSTLRWAVPGLQEDALGMLYVMGRTTIFEMAQGVRQLGWYGRGLAWELNAWGKNPLLPPPSLKGSAFRTDLRRTPTRALSLPPGHPDRREWPEDGITCLTVDGLTFVVNSEPLERFQKRRGLLEKYTYEAPVARQDDVNGKHQP